MFTNLGEAWNNLFVGFMSRRINHLSPTLYSRMNKGLSVGELIGDA